MPYRKAMKARRAVDVIVFDEIKRRRDPDDRGNDITGWLITDQEAGDGLADQELRDQIVSLVAAGYDTTAAAMGWAAAELAASPERAALIRTEVRDTGATKTLAIEQSPRSPTPPPSFKKYSASTHQPSGAPTGCQ